MPLSRKPDDIASDWASRGLLNIGTEFQILKDRNIIPSKLALYYAVDEILDIDPHDLDCRYIVFDGMNIVTVHHYMELFTLNERGEYCVPESSGFLLMFKAIERYLDSSNVPQNTKDSPSESKNYDLDDLLNS